jgi:hypothetical protein
MSAEPDKAGVAAAMLQRIVDGDDADDVTDDALFLLTNRHDASRLVSGRPYRRLQNKLLHNAEAYRRLTAAVGDAFATEVEAAGMRLVKNKITGLQVTGQQRAP